MNYKTEADRLFSLLVRQSSADENGIVTCCTCGKMHHWRKVNCGHYMVRQRQSTRFDRKNTDIQCINCNFFNQGEQVKFGEFLDAKYGKGTAEQMQIKSQMTQHRGAAEYKYLIEQFKTELKQKGYLLR